MDVLRVGERRQENVCTLLHPFSRREADPRKRPRRSVRAAVDPEAEAAVDPEAEAAIDPEAAKNPRRGAPKVDPDPRNAIVSTARKRDVVEVAGNVALSHARKRKAKSARSTRNVSK